MSKGCKVNTMFLLYLALVLVKWSVAMEMHTMHLSTDQPDRPEFALKTMETAAYVVMDARPARSVYPFGRSPYNINVNCGFQETYRRIDGTCNSIVNQWQGAAKTPLVRLSDTNGYQDGVNSPRVNHYSSGSPMPTARKVSETVTLMRSNRSSVHSHLLMNWGQFVDHDITLSPEMGGEGGSEAEKEECCSRPASQHVGRLRDCFPILTPNDSVFKRKCIPFLRSSAVLGKPGSAAVRNQMNDLTAYIDASQIYGSTNIKARYLRSFKGGLLKSRTSVYGEMTLPPKPDNPNDCTVKISCQYIAGDVRSTEQAGLTSVHTLVLREHNRIAKALKAVNNGWDDEKLYQEARKIIGAILQRITYNEFLPEVLGKSLMGKYRLNLLKSGRFRSYSSAIDSSVLTEFSTAAYRFGHSLVRQTFSRISPTGTTAVQLKDMFDAFNQIDANGDDAFLKGLSKDSMESVDRDFSFGLRNDLFGKELDLFALNIQRGRDHGLPSYNTVRKDLNLRVHNSYGQLASNTHSLAITNFLKQVYPKTGDMELFTAGVTEHPVAGGVVGETFAHIIGTQFKRFRHGDSFWHENPRTGTKGFTDGQLKEVRKATLAMLYCNNVNNPTVRRKMLRLGKPGNQAVNCNKIAKMSLSAWRE